MKGESGSSIRWWGRLAMNKMLLLMLGGAIGTYARYALGKWINSQPWAQGFPYATLVINVTGSFILAFASVIILERLRPEYQYLYLLIVLDIYVFDEQRTCG